MVKQSVTHQNHALSNVRKDWNTPNNGLHFSLHPSYWKLERHVYDISTYWPLYMDCKPKTFCVLELFRDKYQHTPAVIGHMR